MTNGVTTAEYRLESGLVCLARLGTSALSKRHTEKNGVRTKPRGEKNGTRDIPGPMTTEKCQMRNGKCFE
jgi:hypothetical protein